MNLRLAAAGVTLALAGALPAVAEPWRAPACAAVRGTDLVTFSPDRGRTLAPTRRRPAGIVYTRGLVALSRPNALLAVSGGTVLRSNDAGCSWFALGSLGGPQHPIWRLSAGPGGVAYAWYENEPLVWRIQGARLAALRAPEGLIGLAVDARDGRRLRAVDGSGVVYESRDRGATWQRFGGVPQNLDALFYRAAFDPADVDHLIVGLSNNGAFASFDGGLTWGSARGLSKTGGPVNVFEAVVSPRDARVVWAMGIDLDEHDAGAPSQGRHVYRSDDGGRTFSPVVDADAVVTLRNGPVMAADPFDRDGLWFVFGTSFADYGTDLFRYDHATGAVARRHNAYDDVGALAFDPAAPSVLYLGVISERGIQ